ncbi:MAG: hypothetical protein HZB23_03625 [Deltaproteobacteria bacterium]|nr:hypothetical protein [Deltaproteobacteria bacterium]
MDPVTGRPNEEKRGRNAEEAEAERVRRLTEQAAFQGITETPEGRVFLNLVQDKFNARVAALVLADPEANALLSLMNELGLKERQAESAALELAGRRFPKKS